MKKTLAGLCAATIGAAGLVAFSGATAQADPYPGTIPTYCKANPENNPRKGNPAVVNFKATSDGNGRPSGTVTFTYRKGGEVVKSVDRSYDGGMETYKLGKLGERGEYKVTAKLRTPKNSAYKNCSKSFEQRQRGKKN